MLCTITEFTFEHILQNCKNLEFLFISDFAADDSYNNRRNVRTKNELIKLKYLSITRMHVPDRWFNFISDFIQACSEVVTLILDSK